MVRSMKWPFGFSAQISEKKGEGSKTKRRTHYSADSSQDKMDYAEEQEMEFEVRTCERANVRVWGRTKMWGEERPTVPLAARA